MSTSASGSSEENSPQDWIETAWEYELAIDVRFGPGREDRYAYFRTVDDRVSHHKWFRVEPEQSRWALVTEGAVKNVLENAAETQLREPEPLLSELEIEN